MEKRDLLRLTTDPKRPEPQVEGVETVEDAVERLEELERSLQKPLVGRVTPGEEPEHRPNREERRAQIRAFKRMVRRPVAVTSLRHPLLKTLTPHGEKVLKRRRAKAKAAKRSRRRNR